MTERTKIERVGGHLLITGDGFVNPVSGGTFTASSAYPIESLVLDEKPTHVTVGASNDRAFFNVDGWTAREILEVAYGPQVDTEKTIADLRATVKVQRDRVKALESLLLETLSFVPAGLRDAIGELIGDEAAKVGR